RAGRAPPRTSPARTSCCPRRSVRSARRGRTRACRCTAPRARARSSTRGGSGRAARSPVCARRLSRRLLHWRRGRRALAADELVGDLAPLAIVAGLTGPLLRPVLAISLVERLRVLAHPFVALPVWAVNLYAWHLPYLYGAALHHDSIHALEHGLFFGCGALMW